MQSLWGDDHTCGTKYIRKNGTTSAGAQRYRCTKCGRSATVGGPGKGYDDDFRRMVVQATREMSIRDVAATFDISPTTVIKWRRERGTGEEHQHDTETIESDCQDEYHEHTQQHDHQNNNKRKDCDDNDDNNDHNDCGCDVAETIERGECDAVVDTGAGDVQEETFDDRIAKLRAKLPDRYDPTRGKKQQPATNQLPQKTFPQSSDKPPKLVIEEKKQPLIDTSANDSAADRDDTVDRPQPQSASASVSYVYNPQFV